MTFLFPFLLCVHLPFVADAIHVIDQSPLLAFLQKTASVENQELAKARNAHVDLTFPLRRESTSH